MIQDKQVQELTPRQFLRKFATKTALSAVGFLEQHREYLLTGELAKVTAPIIQKVDSKEIFPTPAMQKLQEVILAHILKVEAIKAETKSEKIESDKEIAPIMTGKISNSWICTILNPQGEVCTRVKDNGEVEDLVKSFDDSSSADRWADRRLFLDSFPDWYAEIVHSNLPVKTTILRDDAVSRMMKKKLGPVMHVRSQNKTVGFGSKCKESRSVFSRG